MTKVTKEVEELFNKVRTLLGAGVRGCELEDAQLCELLEVAIEDYSEKVQNEIIANNWMGFYGKNVNNTTDLIHAFMARSFDMSKDYSYWFSKQVGLQQEGPWELKKDFITVEDGKQVYIIPSGRTINKVMYVQPPMTDTALFANYMGAGMGFFPGMGHVGMGYGYGSTMGGFFTTQACDVAYLASDLNFKNRLFRGDLVYKITAGPDGTRLLHLLSTPGSKLSFAQAGYRNGITGLLGCQVWYTYYDTSNGDEDECMRYHSDDVVLRPDQVPIGKLDYAFLNEPTKITVRQLLVAKAKQTLGLIRGKFSGKVNIPQAELSMDYNMFIQQGKEEYDKAMEELMKRLERLRPVNIIKEQSELVEYNNKIQQHTPLGIYVI